MKAWLILQEGPGAGYSYPLDPAARQVLSVGRSSQCDVPLKDNRASRHHGDIRWNGHRWEVVDRGSTNGTYVNGVQVHKPYELRLGDRITVGDTTMVIRDSQPKTARQPQLRPAVSAGRTAEGKAIEEPAPRPAPATGTTVAFWLAQGLVTISVICLGAGAFLPWLKITGSLSQDLAPLVQSIAELVATLSGSESILNVQQTIDGLQGYGRLTLGMAVITAIILAVDIFFHRKGIVPGVIYLALGIVASGAMGFDLINYYRYYEELQDLSLLFGVQLQEVVQVFDQFIDVQVTPMIGLYLTAAGLLLLLIGSIARLAIGLLRRPS
ncbi:MAG: FHA domain-containing protein [Anaerolineae bacterium]|jgi:hypothetical protein